MADATAAAADEQPFHPDLTKLFANFVAWWNTVPDDEKEDATPVFEFFMPGQDEPYPRLPGVVYLHGWHTITYGHLLELVRRDTYAEKTRLELAEACATLRQERNDGRFTAIALTAYMRIAGVNRAELAAILSRTPEELPAWLVADEAAEIAEETDRDVDPYLAERDREIDDYTGTED